MSDDLSVTGWMRKMQEGDPQAARELWGRYFAQLARVARARIPEHARRAFDEEDVALSALRSFLDGAREERFPKLDDRHDLWSLLVVITRRKAARYLRHQRRLKRGGGLLVGESALSPGGDLAVAAGFDALLDDEPTPAFAVEAAEQCRVLLDGLGDDALRSVAVLKMQGHTVEEIAARTDSTRRTVERRLQMIRKCWGEASEAEEAAAGEDAP